MEQDNQQVNAVHERDLDNLLTRFGIKEKFDDGQIYCKFCDIIVNKENIHSVLPESEGISVICDKPGCITALLGYLDEKKRTKIEQ